MKKFVKLFGMSVLALVIGLMTTGCGGDPENFTLGTPKNVKVEIESRTMTVTWDAVKNASGYEIVTTSEGCMSGNRTINTKANTAVVTSSGDNALKTDKSNGAVEIINAAKIQITLMPMSGDGNENKPMATKVTAKVKALGGKSGGNEYLDSKFSSEVSKDTGTSMGGM